MARKGTLEIKIVGDHGPLQKTLGDLPGMVKGAGKLLAGAFAVVGVAAATAFTSSLFEAMDREKWQDKLQGRLRLTEGAAKRSGEAASEVYAEAWGDNIEEVMGAIQRVGEGLVDLEAVSKKELKDVARNALVIADTFDQDVNEVIRSAEQLIRNDLVASTDEAFDLITRSFQEGGGVAGDLLDTINEYAEPLESLGIGGTEAVGIFTEALEDGAFNADKVGDAIKEFSIRAVEDTPDVTAAFETLGLDADELQAKIAEGGPAAREAMGQVVSALQSIEDPLARERAGVALFGSMWEDVGGDIILNALDPMKGKIEDVEGATNDLAETVGTNASTRFEEFKRRAGEALVTWSQDNVLPALERVMDAFEEDGLAGALDQVAVEWERAWPHIEAWLNTTVYPWLVDFGKAAGAAMGKAFLSSFGEAIANIPALVGRVGSSIGVSIGRDLAAPDTPSDIPPPPAPSGGGGGGGGTATSGVVMHSGGIVPGRPGQEVPALLEAGERVIPKGRSARADGDTYNITVNAPHYVGNKHDLARAVKEVLADNKRRNGSALAGI